MNNKKKSIMIISVCFILIISISFVVIRNKNVKSKYMYTSYNSIVKVDLVSDDNKQSSYTLRITDDGKNSKANLSYYNDTVYMTKGKLIYSKNGEYKSIKDSLSYRDIYKIISNIDLGNKISINEYGTNYNPKLDNETINKILDSINLGKNTKEERNVFIVMRNNVIEEFSLYLTGIEDYISCNIVVTFSNLDNTRVEIPKIYKELLSEGDKKDLSILQDNVLSTN